MNRKGYALLFLFFSLQVLIVCDGHFSDDFIFSETGTWPERIAPRLYSNSYESLENNGLHYPPIFFLLEKRSESDAVISFCYSFSGGASWYTRDFKYDDEQDMYEFLVYRIGGRTQLIRFVYDDVANKISIFAKEKGIGGDTDWVYFSELCPVSENYVP